MSFEEDGTSDPYLAFAVDLHGTALARQELAADDERAAMQEARTVLTRYSNIEVWHEHRLVGRIRRERSKKKQPANFDPRDPKAPDHNVGVQDDPLAHGCAGPRSRYTDDGMN
jgi:hypothetical protein